MNFKNSEEVIEAVQLLKLEPKVLDGNLSSFVLNNILRKFTNETKYNYPLWDKIEDSRAYKNKDAWKLLSKILKDKEVILFFDFADDKTMFLFSDGGVLSDVIGNCFNFIYYITNMKTGFLLAFNDHHYLIGAGDARIWITNIESNG